MNELGMDFQVKLAELAAIEAESIGWLPPEAGAYLHVDEPNVAVSMSSAYPMHMARQARLSTASGNR